MKKTLEIKSLQLKVERLENKEEVVRWVVLETEKKRGTQQWE
jgi:hypothetical protein